VPRFISQSEYASDGVNPKPMRSYLGVPLTLV
jgi:hypothetical protein